MIDGMHRIPKTIINFLGWMFTIGCCSIILGCVAALLVIRHYSEDLPDYSALAKYDPPTLTRIYANDGHLLAEFATERRVFVPLKAIPKRVSNAFISAEDKNFYNHTGLDYTSIARAVYTNLIHVGKGKSMVGGSTITQQVVKNFLLTNERTFERKIKEAILALRISGAYNKDKILELYLNEIFLGMRSYGVATAALNYFNKSLEELTIEEAALLASMPKAPSSYDPRKNPTAALDRRNWVIKRMHEDGHISTEEAKAALATSITLKSRTEDDVVEAGFFAEEVRRNLAQTYGGNVVNEGGLVVRTTLDPNLQKFADKALRNALITYDRKRGYRGPLTHIKDAEWKPKLEALSKSTSALIDKQRLGVVTALDNQRITLGFTDGNGTIPFSTLKWTRRVLSDGVLGPEVKKPSDILSVGDVVIAAPTADKGVYDLAQIPAVNGGMVVIEPQSGRVLAMSGGYSSGATDFNRATQALRQPGSAFKPFVYLTALENGFSPSSVVLDAPIELSQGAGLPAWRPANYKDEYLGPATLREGLAKSRNTMTVRIAQAIGIDRVLEMGQRLGIYGTLPRNMSIVLGTAETSVTKLVAGYAMMVNGGLRVTPSLIERIDDRHGKTIFRLGDENCETCRIDDLTSINAASAPPELVDMRERVIDPRIAYQMISMLQDVVQRGTATKAKVLGRPLGGKTGTTNESRDTWFVGFSPNLVVGLYIGYDTPRTLGKKETGSSVSLPAFIEFMQAALKDTPPEEFSMPSGVETRVVAIEPPDVLMPRSEHELEASGSLEAPPPTPSTGKEDLVINSDEPIFKPEAAKVLDEQIPVRKPLGSSSDYTTEENSVPVPMEPLPQPARLPWDTESPPQPAPTPPADPVEGLY
jgi:penicillin-binding protein 1A